MRPSSGIGVLGAVLVVVSGLEILTSGPLTRIDRRVALSFAPVTTTPWSHFAMFLNDIGKPVLACLIVGLLGLAMTLRHRRIGPILAVIVGLLVVGVTTLVLKRIFPHNSIVFHQTGSFPSGHTGVAVVSAGLVLWFLLAGRRQALVFLGAALWGALMAWGRLVVEAHWLSDVIAGWGIGMVALVLALRTADSPLGRRGWARPAPADR